MNAKMTRLALVGATVATLGTGLLVGGVSAKTDTPDQLTINLKTFEASAPADFTPGEAVTLWYNVSDGPSVAFPEVAYALADGSLDWMMMPGDYRAIPAGAVNLVAQGEESGQQAIYTFASTMVPTTPMLTIDPRTLMATAPAGSFLPGEEIGMWYNVPDGPPVTFPEVTVALADGSLSWTIDAADYAMIPANAINLVVQGEQTSDQAIYTFAH
jgi:hypothetical protein